MIDDLSLVVGDKQESVGVVPLAEDVLSMALATTRRGERNHPAINVFVEEVVRTAARLIG
ncbi:hypothetical protein [Paraburkholderia sp. EG286A]|uniref:hypothetical protein n=1 Tax=unclassified Paraburkholderia TaxID=2615204 RepID=UPI0034D16DBD